MPNRPLHPRPRTPVRLTVEPLECRELLHGGGFVSHHHHFARHDDARRDDAPAQQSQSVTVVVIVVQVDSSAPVETGVRAVPASPSENLLASRSEPPRNAPARVPARGDAAEDVPDAAVAQPTPDPRPTVPAAALLLLQPPLPPGGRTDAPLPVASVTRLAIPSAADATRFAVPPGADATRLAPETPPVDEEVIVTTPEPPPAVPPLPAPEAAGLLTNGLALAIPLGHRALRFLTQTDALPGSALGTWLAGSCWVLATALAVVVARSRSRRTTLGLEREGLLRHTLPEEPQS